MLPVGSVEATGTCTPEDRALGVAGLMSLAQ